MNMVTLSWIAYTGYLLEDLQQIITNPNLPEATMSDQVHDTTVKTETGKVNPDHNLLSADFTARVIAIYTEITQGHNTRINTATTGAAHNAHTAPIEVTVIDLAVTYHTNLIADHPHIEILQLTTPEIAVDHTHEHPTNLQGKTHTNQVHIPADHKANHTSGRTWWWKLEIYTWRLIMDCPIITKHAGNHFKALIDSEAAISHIR